ncbi:hypothetical protein GCM10022276_13990 [Sphingomonas limnosediminicola]|uniref:Uncharacterized protein n=1 Tax=Sphingomonas limnosediminicola TaxID=940133 RepID=A0ABP7LC71_9SPHN
MPEEAKLSERGSAVADYTDGRVQNSEHAEPMSCLLACTTILRVRDRNQVMHEIDRPHVRCV